MTKHLRFLFIALLMAVWTGGWAQTWEKTDLANLTSDDVFVIVDIESTGAYAMSNNNGTGSAPTATNVTLSADKNQITSAVTDVLKWTLDNNSGQYTFYPNGDKKKWLYCTDKNNGVRVGTNSNKVFLPFAENAYNGLKNSGTKRYVGVYNEQDWRCYSSTTTNIESTKISYFKYTAASTKTNPALSFANASVDVTLEDKTTTVQTITTAEGFDDSNITYESSDNNIATVAGTTINLIKEGEVDIIAKSPETETYAAGTASYKLVIKSNRKDPGLAFKKESYNFDVNDITFPSADYLDNPNSVAVKYFIDPTSNNAKIDVNTGVAKISEPGEYTITAKFNGNDTYKPATATCKLVVTNGNIETKTVTFEVGVDKGLATKPGDQGKELMTKDCIKINSENANFSGSTRNNKSFRFYQTNTKYKGETTFSTTIGKITKIEFIAEGSKNFPDKFETSVGTYDKTNYVWTGEETNITFTATQSVWATKIIVTVAVPQAKAYIFDETSESNTVESYENANVTLKRSNLVTDNWNTFCVPFAISAEDITNTWGDGTELRTFDRMSGNTMYFKKAESIEAGKPYLVKPTKVTTGDLIFNGVQTVADAVNRVGEGEYFMVGTYNAIQLAEDGSRLFLSTNNEFKKPQQNSAKMKGMRVYFEVPANTKPAELRANIDGVETGINAINGIEGDTTAPVYNLQGQCVGNSLRSLAPGIYVQGGKKYVVK